MFYLFASVTATQATSASSSTRGYDIVTERVSVSVPAPDEVLTCTATLNDGVECITTTTIKHPDAELIKLHVSSLSFPPGNAILVVSAEGEEGDREEYTYTGNPDNIHESRVIAPGDHTGSFYTMSISGSTAVVKLTLRSPAHVKHPVGILNIDSYIAHVPKTTDERLLPEDPIDVACVAAIHPGEHRRSLPVARIARIDRYHDGCAAWRVGQKNVLMTDRRCIEDDMNIGMFEVWFNWHYSICGSVDRTVENVTKVAMWAKIDSDPVENWLLFSVRDFPSIAKFGYLGLDVRKPRTHERVFIPHFSDDRPMQMSIHHNENMEDGSRGFCRAVNGDFKINQSTFQCNTANGGLGSPVISRRSWKVIAFYHGACGSEGMIDSINIAAIWRKVTTYFDDIVPDDKASDPMCNVPGNSCRGACGEESKNRECGCDATCVETGDCCLDFEAFCPDIVTNVFGAPPEEYRSKPAECTGRLGYNASIVIPDATPLVNAHVHGFWRVKRCVRRTMIPYGFHLQVCASLDAKNFFTACKGDCYDNRCVKPRIRIHTESRVVMMRQGHQGKLSCRSDQEISSCVWRHNGKLVINSTRTYEDVEFPDTDAFICDMEIAQWHSVYAGTWQCELGSEYVDGREAQTILVQVGRAECEEDFFPSKTQTRYSGCQFITEKGYVCANWLVANAHAPYSSQVRSQHTLENNNLCRDYDNHRPWCYITEDGSKRDYCNALGRRNLRRTRRRLRGQ